MTSKISGPKVLLIGRDQRLLKLLAKCLTPITHVKRMKTLEQGITHALSNKYNFLIISTDLSIQENINLIEKFRSKNKLYPILIIGPDNPLSQINACKLGITTYHCKPIKCDLLKAQVTQLINFFDGKIIFELGNILIDTNSESIHVRDKKKNLTSKEYALLCLLIKAEGRIMSRAVLCTHLSNYNKDISYSAIDTLVCRLRFKLRDVIEPSFIQTVHQIGYRINPRYFKKFRITTEKC